MSTTNWPRTDAEITFSGAFTCTHHNDAERTACPVCLVATLTAERDHWQGIAQTMSAEREHNANVAQEMTAERDQLRTCGELSCDECNARTAALTAERDELRDRLAAAQHRGATAIASWDEERYRALREGKRVVEWRDRAEKAEADLIALEKCHDDNCRAVVAIAAELATITVERDQLRDSSAFSKTQQESAKWWAQFFLRRRFPQRGMFFIVPGDDPGEAVILHAHSGRKMDFRLDRGETWAQSRQIFEAALPHADEIALPAGTNPDEAPLPNVKAQPQSEDGR